MAAPRIKLYPPHLDAPLSKAQAEFLVAKPERVERHAFFPFLQRNQHWTKFVAPGKPQKVKDRPIRYASRRDSYIFSHYRSLLCPMYEQALKNLCISDCVLAYRRIQAGKGKGGKCNIHFANEAFNAIHRLGDCVTFAFDIEHFFENLDHAHIKRMWTRLLNISGAWGKITKLPLDHSKVFHAVTSYSSLDVEEAYRRLGFIGEVTGPDGTTRIKYLVSRDEFPPRICSAEDFRLKLSPLIKSNKNPYGIPQGSPISDLLANVYMLDFDASMLQFVKSLEGTYFRYSDDILLLLPASGLNWRAIPDQVEAQLKKYAPRLKLKAEKTQVYRYTSNPSGSQDCAALSGKKAPDGLEYLGFRFDGKRIFLRNSTISGVQRKISASARRMAISHLKRNPTLDLPALLQSFDYGGLIYRFGRIREFDAAEKKYNRWTFWTYIKRALMVMGSEAKPLNLQVSNYRKLIRKKAKDAIEKVYKKRFQILASISSGRP
jgi:hypothetical protein